METHFTGEHYLPGLLGNFFIILSFTSALLATVSFYFASKSTAEKGNSEIQTTWNRIAHYSFFVHGAAVIFIISTLFFMLLNHYYEYHYVWQHSNNEMPLRYIFSCFWEGQEGSFLLWTFWNVVLGIILMFTLSAKSGIKPPEFFNWENPVMAIFSSVQVFLTSMLLGIYFNNFHIGSNPFTVLLREHPDFSNAPIFQNAGYLSQIDGRGLNPLLQNYWMTIHPPTLFLGFALTLVPFCFAVSALWQKKFTQWIKPALPWTFFGIAILGLGVLMGGAWAYEALSFGGFWAWDPVENASLVPWITLVGAGHVMLINKKKESSSGMLFFLAIITFLLILYSTFLTRSGILGDASVHAFTDLGMSGQLLIYLFFYFVLSLILFFSRLKELKTQKEEDALLSREFWMFICALVLLVSAFQISSTTSIPVFNKIFNSHLAPPAQAIEHYNSWQVPMAIIISFIMGFSQHLKYKKTGIKKFIIQVVPSVFVSLGISLLFGYLTGMLHLKNLLYLILLLTSSFAVLGNLDYFLRIMKGKVAGVGPSMAHVGFGMILFGALVSQSQQKNISTNVSGVDIEQVSKELQNQENTLLFKNDTVPMGDYFVSYSGKRKEGINVLYKVDYLSKDSAGSFVNSFSLFPRVQINPRMGNVSEPDTRHFWSKDIYTHVTYAELEENKVEESDFNEPENHKMGKGDTIFSTRAIIVLQEFNTNVDRPRLGLNDSDLAVGARLNVTTMNGKKFSVLPVFILRKNVVFPVYDEIPEEGLRFTFGKIFPQENKIEISVFESKKKKQKEFIIMKAVLFPYINVLWAGSILFFLGTLISVYQRIKKNIFHLKSTKELK